MARPGQPVFQLHISLENVDPPVWRRLLVPGSGHLGKLHLMIQAAFGWSDSHLHSFRIGDLVYGPQFDDYPEEELDETSVSVLRALEDVQHFGYEYDFGDSWDHVIVVEDLRRPPIPLRFGVCLDGQNACPPEDVGGPWGYSDFVQAVGDPQHEDHERLLAWAGGPFDPAEFDLAVANGRLQTVK